MGLILDWHPNGIGLYGWRLLQTSEQRIVRDEKRSKDMDCSSIDMEMDPNIPISLLLSKNEVSKFGYILYAISLDLFALHFPASLIGKGK